MIWKTVVSPNPELKLSKTINFHMNLPGERGLVNRRTQLYKRFKNWINLWFGNSKTI